MNSSGLTFRAQKRAVLQRANLDLGEHLLRSACELKCISLRQYESVARDIRF